MKPSTSLRLVRAGSLAAVIASFLAVHSAQAATGTWSGPDLTGTWDTGTTNWGGVAAGTPWAAAGNDALINSSGNTINASGAVYVTTMNIDSFGNTVNFTDGATMPSGYKFCLMGTGHTSASSGNTLNMSTTGLSGARTYYISGNSSSFWVGGDGNFSTANTNSYSYNNLLITNGANFGAAGGNGNTNCFIGATIGSNYNSMLVRGSNGSNRSNFSNGGQRLYVGGYGNNNSLTVDQGGQVSLRVLHVGAGGSSNALTVDGIGGGTFSYLKVTEDMNIGDSDTNRFGTGNTVTVSGGAHLESQTRNGRVEFSTVIGKTAAGSNNNSLTITGAGSQWLDNGYHVILGSGGGPAAPVWIDAQDNSLNISDGASATINTGLVLSGTRSSFNLGDGNHVGTAVIGSTRDGAVALSVADARLNFNNGWLTANVTGNLVSGLGKIDLKGPAYVSNATGLSNIISVVIEDTTLSGGAFIKEGAGTLTLNAANTYSGDTTVHGGTLVADSATNAYVLSSDSTLVLGRGGKFKFMGAGDAMASQVMDGLTLKPGGNSIEVSDVGGGGLTLDLRGDGATLGIYRGTSEVGGTVDFKATTGTLGATALVLTAQTNLTAGILGAWATVNDGAGLACNDGTDSIIAYTGYSDVTLGTSVSGSQTTNYRIIDGGAGPIVLGTTIQTLTQNSATEATVNNNTQTLRVGSSGGILITPTGAALIIGSSLGDGALSAGDGPGLDGELVLGNFSGNALTINAAITNNDAGVVTLTKSGGGEAKLMWAGSYTGATFVGAGTLTCEAAGAIGSGPLTVSGGTLAMGAYSEEVAAVNLTAGSITGTGTLASTVGFALDGSTATSCSAILDGAAVGLVKSGPGTATLSGANTYGGATVVNAGTLAYGIANAIGEGTVTVDGGILAMGAFSDEVGHVTLTAGAITGSGTLSTTSGITLNGSGSAYCTAILDGHGMVLEMIGTGTVSLGAANTYSGGTRIDSGTLICAATGAIGIGPVTVNGGTLAMGAASGEVGQVTLTAGAITGSGTLTSAVDFVFDGSAATSCSAILAGSSVGLVKSGAGTATLSGVNTYGGDTNIEVGTLVVKQASAFSDLSTVRITSGAFLGLDHTGTDTIKQLYIGGTQMPAGTHGSLTSTATFKSASFTGTGMLNVTEGPPPLPNLGITANPDTFKETDGTHASTGTVTIPDALGYDLEVTLSTTDPLTANVATSVTIYTGETAAQFWIEAVNNPLVQTTRTATLTASSSGYNNATTLVTVTKGGYESWKTANAGGEAANLDYDKDGVSNGVEFFMGETGSTFTPNPSVVDGKVSWPYDANTAGSGMTYQVMTSTDLVIWSPVEPQPVPAAGKLEYILPTGNTARFVRLEVTTP